MRWGIITLTKRDGTTSSGFASGNQEGLVVVCPGRLPTCLQEQRAIADVATAAVRIVSVLALMGDVFSIEASNAPSRL